MKLIVDGQLVSYVEEGKGRIILLLHGWGVDLKTFDTVVSQLGKKYRVIRLDFPGFGGSPRPTNDWHVDDYAKFVAAFLNKLKIDSLYAVIGHSFGGRVIIKAVSKGYVRPEHVVLVGSAGVRPQRSAKLAIYKAIAKTGKQVTKLPGLGKFRAKLRQRLYQSAGSTDYLNAESMRQIFLNTINEDLQSDATKIAIPALLIWGEDDAETPVIDGQKLHQAIADSKFVVIPQAGHFVYLDQPGRVMKELEAFL